SAADYSPRQHFLILDTVAHRVILSFPTRRSSDLGVESMKIVADYAHGLGIKICVEAWDRFDNYLVNNFDDAKMVVDAVDRCNVRSEEHTSELQSRFDLVCRLLLEKKMTSRKEAMD